MGYRVNNLLYAAGSDLINTIRVCVTLNEPIYAPALEKALKTAAVRFPYFSVKLVRRGETLILERNPLPFVVSPGGRTLTLGTEESNHHLFAFAYDGCRLFVDGSHFITDGNGMFPFLKTVLYYYLSALHPDEKFDTGGIALSVSEIPDAEADDYPYPEEPVETEPLGSISRPEKLFMLPDQPQGYENMGGWTSFLFRIRQREMMAYVSSIDGSPATFIASLMYRVIAELYPENRLPLVCGMQHQFRKALGRPYSHMCHVNVIPMVYPDSLRGMDIETLNTIARGMLILRADDANDILTVNEHVRNEAMIRGLPLSQKHDYMRSVIRKGIGKNTFEVSYTGRVPWSGLDKYVENVFPAFDMTLSGGLSIEIFSFGEYFSINIMQRNGDTRYADRFAVKLDENGIAYEAAPPERFSLCGFCLPD